MEDVGQFDELKTRKWRAPRDYLTRFNATAVEVSDLDQTIVVAAVVNGLMRSRLTLSLFKSPPKTLPDLMRKADKYMRAEEVMSTRKDDEEGAQVKKRKNPEMRPKGEEKQRQGGVEGHPPPQRIPPRRFEQYTALNTSRARILELEKDRSWIRFPGKLKSDPEKRDKKKYYRFHGDHGHDTEECINLKDLIEEKIRGGHLRQYREEQRKDDRKDLRDYAP